MLPENRKLQGVLIEQDVKTILRLRTSRKCWREILSSGKQRGQTAKEYVQRLGVKTPTIYQKVKSLSGGNQQKVILAKWLFTKPQVLIFDEPTQGIDVGAKHEIYRLIADFVKEAGESCSCPPSSLSSGPCGPHLCHAPGQDCERIYPRAGDGRKHHIVCVGRA